MYTKFSSVSAMAVLISIASAGSVVVRQAVGDEIDGYTYVSCQTLGDLNSAADNHFTLVDAGVNADEFALEDCIDTCIDAENIGSIHYAAISGSQCMCGVAFPAGIPAAPAASCNTPCAGDDEEICGGTNFWSLYTMEQGEDGEAPDEDDPAMSSTTLTTAAASTASANPTTLAAVPVSTTTATVSTVPMSKSSSISSAAGGMTTSTIYSTKVMTITSCAPAVTNCPASLSTTLISISTTVYPIVPTTASGPKPTGQSSLTVVPSVGGASGSPAPNATDSVGPAATPSVVPFKGAAASVGRLGLGMLVTVAGFVILL